MRLLVVEDNKKLAGYLKTALERKSYSVDLAYDGETGEQQARYNDYDVIVLDIMLPGKDGIAICRSLRQDDINTPILMLTAKVDSGDKVMGLDSGADDYLLKPFDLDELLARIRALLRRPREKAAETLTAQDIALDSSAYTATKATRPISLTLKEYAVLEYLLRHKGMVVTREQILDHCWDHGFDSFSNIVDVYIKQLRKKLADSDETYIKTIRGVGYQFKI